MDTLKLWISIEKWFVWFFINFVFCIIPLCATYFFQIGNPGILFTSYLAYLFTSLLASLYSRREQQAAAGVRIYSDLLSWIVLFFVFAIWSAYIFYNLNRCPSEIFSNSLFLLSCKLYAVTLCFSVLLNRAVLSENIDREYGIRKRDETDKIGKKVNKMKGELGAET
jgi:hypothetical protein